MLCPCSALEGAIAIGKQAILLVNSNRVRPPVAPLGLEYLAGALRREGHRVELVDLSWTEDPHAALAGALRRTKPGLVAVSFRNSDDCFWPSAHSFVPELRQLVHRLRTLTDAPLLLGGAGFSVFPLPILRATGCEFGVCGEGEGSLLQLASALGGDGRVEHIPGLAWRTDEGRYAANPPRPASPLSLPTGRDHLDNRRYFTEGGQAGLETKRGCDRRCTYCADPLIKGRRVRTRTPAEVADEVESLLRQGVDVLHLCDSEFNVPYRHAMAVCCELARRGLGRRVRWYTYAAVDRFDSELAAAMRRAGCVGIDFGADSASPQMLRTYGRRHGAEDIASAVRACQRHGLRVMTDLLLGGPGETEATLRETIEFMKRVGPDCVGAALGVRLYPGTALAGKMAAEGGLRDSAHLRTGQTPSREGDDSAGTADLLRPVFYISAELGEDPAGLVCDLIGEDERFFKPVSEQSAENYNYNENRPLSEAIRAGARGAYWDILRGLKQGQPD